MFIQDHVILIPGHFILSRDENRRDTNSLQESSSSLHAMNSLFSAGHEQFIPSQEQAISSAGGGSATGGGGEAGEARNGNSGNIPGGS